MVALRISLVAGVLGALLVQVLVPIQADLMGREFPEVAHLVVPYSVAAILAIVCVQLALVAVWRLLFMVASGRILSAGALAWVDAIVVSAAVWTGLSAAVFVHLIFIVQVGGPGAFLGLAACVVVGAAVALLMVVVRGLLKGAISDRGELAEVI